MADKPSKPINDQPKDVYLLPELGVSVEASSAAEAAEIANKPKENA